MSKDVSIYLVHESCSLAADLAAQISKQGYRVLHDYSMPALDAEFLKGDIGIVMVDKKLLEGEGGNRFRELLKLQKDTAVIFMVESEADIGSLNMEVEGIYDYLLIPASDSHLTHLLDIAIERRARFLLEKYYQKYLEGQVIDQLKSLAEHQVRLLHADRLSSIGQVSAGIIHELNNPLTFMKLNLETMKQFNKETNRIVKEYADRHEGYSFRKMSGDQMVEEVNDMVKSLEAGLSQIEGILGGIRRFSRRPASSSTEFDLHQAISNALNFAKGTLKNNISIKSDFCDCLPAFYGDPQKLEQVFLNILINAAHVLEDERNGEIFIKTEKMEANGESQASISISDNGKGISPEMVGKIFDPFFTTKPTEKGTGLGLSICKEIVGEFSGILSVESQMGMGTTFILLLPIKA